MDNRKQERIFYIEVLRALAAFAVIVIHVAGKNWYGRIGSFEWTVFTVYSGLAKFSVPVFFMVSGALFLRKEKELKLNRLYLHNILHLIIFLVFWSGCYYLQMLMYSGEKCTVNSLWIYIKNLINGNTEVFFWFIYAMIGMYIILPVVKAFINGAEKNHILYFVILCFLFNGMRAWIAQIPMLAPLFINMNKLDIHITGGYLGYYVLGYYLAKYPPTAIVRRIVYGLGVVGIVGGIFATCRLCVSTGACSEIYLNYTFPGVVLWSAAVFLFVQTHGQRVQRGKCIISCVSRCSLGIYGVHMLLVNILWNYGFTTFSFTAPLAVPMISIGVFVGSLLVILVLSKIPGVRSWLI